MQSYDEQSIANCCKEGALPKELSQRQKDRADLKPLEPAPPNNPLAEEVIQRVAAPYAFARFTGIPAALSVTGSLQNAGSLDRPQQTRSAILSLPTFVSNATVPTENG